MTPRPPLMTHPSIVMCLLAIACSLTLLFSGGCSQTALLQRQTTRDFPGCEAVKDGTWYGETLVRVRCPDRAPFIAAYMITPTGANRTR